MRIAIRARDVVGLVSCVDGVPIGAGSHHNLQVAAFSDAAAAFLRGLEGCGAPLLPVGWVGASAPLIVKRHKEQLLSRSSMAQPGRRFVYLGRTLRNGCKRVLTRHSSLEISDGRAHQVASSFDQVVEMCLNGTQKS